MSKLIIKNGLVFDPLNNIEGEKKDILIEGEFIVEKFSNPSDVKEIDAQGKTVIPGALDIHTHIASQQVNWVRLIGTKNSLFKKIWQGLTLEKIARDYINNGYTFILEANVFPSLSKQTLFDFTHLPVLDKGMLLNVSNFWALELEFQRGKIDELSIFLSDLMQKTKAFGLKVYNPFESEDWNFKEIRNDLKASGRLYNFSALDVYENLAKANEHMGLPHSIHAHIEGYETEYAKGNYSLILDKINSLDKVPQLKEKSKNPRSQIFHLAHASAYIIEEDNAELINIINQSNKIDLDIGFLTFNKINPLITSDRKLIAKELKFENEHNILIRSAVEFEGDSFVKFRNFDKNNENHCLMWANGIGLALNIKDKWKVQLSLNYPNYGNINDIAEVATWLLSSDARIKFMKDMTRSFKFKEFLSESNNILSFYEFIILSRASPAKSLGLGNIKGNLGIGADADINILDIDLNNIDTAKQYEVIKNSLKDIEYVIKSGEIIKNRDRLDLSHQGKILWTKGIIEKDESSIILKQKKDFYQKYYSFFYDSLATSINSDYLRLIE
ncbi:MAG: amidohydrolase family protein [Promethearchaeota archaeon]